LHEAFLIPNSINSVIPAEAGIQTVFMVNKMVQAQVSVDSYCKAIGCIEIFYSIFTKLTTLNATLPGFRPPP